MRHIPTLPDNLFLANKDNLAYLRGERSRLAGQGNSVIAVLALFGVVFGLLIFIPTFQDLQTEAALQTSSATTRGTYEEAQVTTDDEGDEIYYLTYQYVVDGVTYRHEVRVDAATYERAEYGASVDVMYVPDSPQLSRIAGQESRRWLLPLGALCTLGSMSLVGLSVWQMRRVQTLERRGQVIFGEVRGATLGTPDTESNLANLTLAYQFRAPDTATIIEEKTVVNLFPADSVLPEVGTPVAVLYRDSRHYLVL